MIFLTTPSIVLSTIERVSNKYRSIDPLRRVAKRMELPVLISSIFPVLLLRIFAATMPSMVSVTSLLEKQWKRSSLDKSMMIKLFVFLVMMILILPSLGLTSVEAFLRWIFENENGIRGRAEIRWMFVFHRRSGSVRDQHQIRDASLVLLGVFFYRTTVLSSSITRSRQLSSVQPSNYFAWPICFITFTWFWRPSRVKNDGSFVT